ncbi:phage replication initiation protein, NGO0469 family [Agathobaculum desmolans]|uniref:phage replication initiation protein, NGO0469 family n=1 Tax=Agathobaculum desmolans TaxID=39484 RepID=UPI00248ED9A3|nr:hypothetical protein [Agathobaculum desmolans]
MSLKAKRKPANNIPPLDGGTYMSVCVGVIDLGEQYRQFDKQKQGKYAEECMFIFGIPSERVQVDGEDKPRWLSSKRYTVSLHERSALYQMLTSWRGKALSDAELDPEGDGFDLMQMAGQGAMLSVSVAEKDDGSRHNKIEAVTGFPKGIPVPKTESEILVFDADDPDMEVYGKLPEWIQDVIRKSTQFADNAPDEKVDIPPDQEAQTAEPAGEECPI